MRIAHGAYESRRIGNERTVSVAGARQDSPQFGGNSKGCRTGLVRTGLVHKRKNVVAQFFHFLGLAGLDIEPQEGFGIARANIEPPGVRRNRETVEFVKIVFAVLCRDCLNDAGLIVDPCVDFATCHVAIKWREQT